MAKAIATFDEGSVRTRAYLLWEADGRPFGRDDHYWGLALAEATAPVVKPKRAAATAAVAEKKAPAKPAKAKAAAKPAKAKAPVAKGKKK